MKKLFLACLAMLFLYLIYFFFTIEVGHKEMIVDEMGQVGRLSAKIDSAKMKTYVDRRYGVKVPYPDFFVADTSESGTARFTYLDTSQQIEVRMVMFVEPNVEGWSIKEAAEELSDSVTVCRNIGDDYFIMHGRAEGFHYVEKCFLADGNWIDYAVYFRNLDEVERLINIVHEWRP